MKIALEHFPKIDILVNNAGVLVGTDYKDTSAEDFDLCYEVNLKSVWQISKVMAPHFKKNGGGKIVNIASIGGRLGMSDIPAYRASKAGVINLTQSLAHALGSDNINVNAVCPGVVETSMADKLGGEDHETDYDELAKGSALGRIASPEDIGQAVVFFASSYSKNITGQALNVDGGVAGVMR